MEASSSGIPNDTFFKSEYPDTVSTLSRAVRIGDIEAIKRLLSKGHLPQVPDNRGWTAVHSCVAAKNLEALKIILKHKGSSKRYLTNLCTWEGETPLIVAVKDEDYSIDIIKTLLELGAKPNKCTNEGTSPLHLACKRKGNLELVKLLVQYGADVNAKEHVNGFTPLHVALDVTVNNPSDESSDVTLFDSKNIDLELIEYLIEVCDVNIADHSNETPLFTACAGNYLQVVKLILKKDTKSVNKIPMIMFSPLSAAAFCGNAEMVELLLQAGADTSFEGRAAIHRHALYQKNFLAIHASLKNVDVFKLLLKHTKPSVLQQHDINVPSRALPIYTMVYAKDCEAFEALLQYEFPPEFSRLKIASFSNLTNFILHVCDYTQDKLLEKFQLFFKYYSHFEPEQVFEHFTCLMSNDELVSKHRFLNILAKMGVPSGDSFSSKQSVIRLLSDFAKTGKSNDKMITDIEETIEKLKEPVLSLKQLSRVATRRYVRSLAENDWSAYKTIRDSCLPIFLKGYLWYQILD